MAKQVQATANDAAVSKLSAVRLGYYNDDFIHFFVPECETARRAPLINRGYFARVRAIELLTERFLAHCDWHTAAQVVCLGAGCDTGFFRLQALKRNPVRYIEVDLPSITAAKIRTIASHADLFAPLGFATGEAVLTRAREHTSKARADRCDTTVGTAPPGSASTSGTSGGGDPGAATSTANAHSPSTRTTPSLRMPGSSDASRTQTELHVQHINAAGGEAGTDAQQSLRAGADAGARGDADADVASDGHPFSEYHIVSADLRDVRAVEKALCRAGFEPSRPTLFISECVLVYMEPELSAPLLAWAAATCASAGAPATFLTYEQLRPNDPFGRTMLGHLERRGCPLRSVEAFPLPSSQVQRFKAAGWQRVRCRDMNSVYYGMLPPGEVARAARRELFDELEEWHMIQAHYGLVVAVLEGRDKLGCVTKTLADALSFFESRDVDVNDDDAALSIPASAGRFID